MTQGSFYSVKNGSRAFERRFPQASSGARLDCRKQPNRGGDGRRKRRCTPTGHDDGEPGGDQYPPIGVDTEKEQSKGKGLNIAEKQKKTAKQNASANQKNKLSDRPEVFVVRALSPVAIVECTETQIVVGYNDNHIVNHNSFFPEKSNSSQSSETIECNSPLPSEKIVPLDGFEIIKPDTPLERIVLLDDPETIAQKTTPLLETTEILKYPETTKKKKKPSDNRKHLSLRPASVEQKNSIF
ncbi:hypothetical protein Taro_033116 [Colocasia esculenta]|uniref:Uncharacterized protein n=1 Tax=Colocasia esculenta TaxID=4460 RepID=A0A843VWW8_COLES|nr:hypothetical protein [Colocasia esculenta]